MHVLDDDFLKKYMILEYKMKMFPCRLEIVDEIMECNGSV
jgi:hypothetical protein